MRDLTDFLVTTTAPCAKEPESLDETIIGAMDLLPTLRSLSPAQLKTLAARLRILSNVAEAWAHRGLEPRQDDCAE